MVNDLQVIIGTKWNDGLDESELKPNSLWSKPQFHSTQSQWGIKAEVTNGVKSSLALI